MLEDALRSVVAEATADPAVRISGLRRLTGGASRETWAFDAHVSGGAVLPLVLRLDTVARFHGTAMGAEAEAMRAAAAHGLPVPEVLAHGEGPVPLGGDWMVMARIEGETLARRILRDSDYAAVRPTLARACGELLGRLHLLPAAAAPGLQRRDGLAVMRGQLDAVAEPMPVFELALRWLERERPPARGPCVVHGDFRNGNLVIGPDGVRAILDWELVHLGEPLDDLGWMCLRPWRFGAEPEAGGFGPRADLLAGYAAVTGVEVDLDELRWWELLGVVRWGVGSLRMAGEQLAGRQRSVELAAVGRRAWEAAYDALRLLEGGAVRA